jgi:phosphopantothenoylcysteine synthetase/decarboxylase
MHILVTAGNTQAPIDQVRCITNIFTGRTGAAVALRAWERGHTVTLLTSHPETVTDLRAGRQPGERWELSRYRTYDDLRHLMAEGVSRGQFGVVIHCAAVSDYLADGVFGAAEGTAFDPATGRWSVRTTSRLVDGKIKSDAPELWLRLVRAPKLVDMVRRDWGFRGVLVKFKLETGIAEGQLLDIAERSRRQSDADLMVANTLEDAGDWALLGPLAQGYERVSRRELPDRLLDAVEALHGGR